MDPNATLNDAAAAIARGEEGRLESREALAAFWAWYDHGRREMPETERPSWRDTFAMEERARAISRQIAATIPSKIDLVAQGSDREGRLPRYTSLGSYPLYYMQVKVKGSCLCASCAEDLASDDTDGPIEAIGTNWEDPDFCCDACGERIESAYGEG